MRKSNRVLKNCAAGRDPALCGFYKCSSAAGGLRFPKCRTPWLTAWCLFFNTLSIELGFDRGGIRIAGLDIGDQVGGEAAFGLDGAVADRKSVQILENQCIPGGKPEGQDAGKEEPEFFKPAAEAGGLGVGQRQDQVNDVPALETKLPQLEPDVGDDVLSRSGRPGCGRNSTTGSD